MLGSFLWCVQQWWSVSFSVLLCVPSADNPLLTTKVTVTVNVLDVNEFPPELALPFDTFVCENTKVGQASAVPLHSSCREGRREGVYECL